MTDPGRVEAFAERLDALGPDLSRWPAGEAEAARELIATSAAANRLHADARALAALLAEAAHAETPNGFAFRVVADVAARRADGLGWLFDSPQRLGLAGASFGVLAVAIGVALGSATIPAQADDVDGDFGSPLISLDADI